MYSEKIIWIFAPENQMYLGRCIFFKKFQFSRKKFQFIRKFFFWIFAPKNVMYSEKITWIRDLNIRAKNSKFGCIFTKKKNNFRTKTTKYLIKVLNRRSSADLILAPFFEFFAIATFCSFNQAAFKINLELMDIQVLISSIRAKQKRF